MDKPYRGEEKEHCCQPCTLGEAHKLELWVKWETLVLGQQGQFLVLYFLYSVVFSIKQ